MARRTRLAGSVDIAVPCGGTWGGDEAWLTVRACHSDHNEHG